jgi:hypothetical protein
MKRLSVITFVAMCTLIFAASCNISNSGDTNPQQGAFLLANVSPDAPPLNIYINNSFFGSGLSYGNYTAYWPATPGSYTFSFFDSSSSSTPKLSKTVNINALTNYSFFVIDSFKYVTSSFVTDNYAKPSGDSIYIRFFNFSPNAGALSLHESTSDSTLYNSRSFNDQDGNSSLVSYNEMKTGASAIFNFELRKPDSTLVASRTDTLSGGHVYTIFAKGNLGGTGDQVLGIGQIQNY